jgi:two-component system, OmpR family, alkaline phosphatase synthesis response regulator PhoP
MNDGTDKGLVLVADDERDIVELLSILLRREGYEVVSASDGTRALELARERRPKLCILDGAMPGMAGFEILSALRDDERTAGTRVLILTATVDEEREIRRHGVQPDGFVQKPFDSNALLAEVSRLVG